MDGRDDNQIRELRCGEDDLTASSVVERTTLSSGVERTRQRQALVL